MFKNLKAQVYFDDRTSGINLFLPAKTYFCRQKVFLPVRVLPWKKTVFSTFWQKPANPGLYELNSGTVTSKFRKGVRQQI